MVNYRKKFASLRLTGTIDQIRQTLIFLEEAGCKFRTEGKFYTVRGYRQKRVKIYNYYLTATAGTLIDMAKSESNNKPHPRS